MILEVDGIRFSYNGHPILADIRFRLGPGEVMGILGINGAGKSTLLKCLNRVLRPSRGRALLEEQDLLRMDRREVARRMGYVPQRHPETRLNVYESVLLGRKPHMGWTVSETDHFVAEDILRRMGLEGLALRPVADLSGGEAQKVAIARALAQSPKVLLLDEPTSNLDLKNQLEVMGLVREVVARRELSAIVSIHDLNLALRFADVFLFLKDHRVHALVPKSELDANTIQDVYGVEVALHVFGEHTVVVPA